MMSGKAKIRKLMNTPSASSARISPTVQDPIKQCHGGAIPARSVERNEPEAPRG